MPFFSIIIPAFNRSRSILKSIKSVLDQTFNNFELIIIDDGSTDDTFKVIQPLLHDKRIIYKYQDNRGVSAARNAGVTLSNASYIIFLDSDDYAAKHWLNEFYSILVNEESDLVLCNFQSEDKKYNYKSIVNTRLNYVKNREIRLSIPGSFCIKKVIFLNAGGYDELMKYGENSELSFRLVPFVKKISFTDRVSLFYQSSIDGGSKNLRNKIDSNLYCLNKHSEFFKKNSKIRFYYLQNIGIAALRLQSFKQGKKYLFLAWMVKPLRIDTLFRLFISFSHFLSIRIWRT